MSRKTSGGRKTAYGAAAVALAILGGGLATNATAAERAITLHVDTRSGPTTGGTGVVVVEGTGFAATDRVWFGQTRATAVRYISATRLEVTPPVRTVPSEVTVDVSVTDGDTHAESSSDGATDDYAFTDSAVISSVVKPTSATDRLWTINGTNLGGATSTVSIGGKEVKVETGTRTAPIAATSSALKVKAPILPGGLYDVVVFSPNGTAVFKNGFGSAPKVKDSAYSATPTVKVKRGSAAGGEELKFFGTGFAGTTEVKLGDQVAQYTVVNDTELRITTPVFTAFPAGKVVHKVALKITNKFGEQTTSNYWQWDALPTVSAVSVATQSVAATGTVNITLTGTNLLGVTAVKFGTTPTDSKTLTAPKQSGFTPAGTAAAATEWKVTLPKAKAGTTTGAIKIYVTTPAGTVTVPGLFSRIA